MFKNGKKIVSCSACSGMFSMFSMFSMFKQCSDFVNCMFITPEHAEHAINCKMAIFFMTVFSYSFACSGMFSMFSMFRSCSNHVQTKYCACSDMYYTLFKPEHTQYMLNMLEHAKHALNPAKHAEHAAPPQTLPFER